QDVGTHAAWISSLHRWFLAAPTSPCNARAPFTHSTGVARRLCNGDGPTRVADAIIDGSRATQDERGYVRLPPRWDSGPVTQYKSLKGTFASCLGLFEGMTNRERVHPSRFAGPQGPVLIGIDAIATA